MSRTDTKATPTTIFNWFGMTRKCCQDDVVPSSDAGVGPGPAPGWPGRVLVCAGWPRNCPGLAPAWSRSLVNGAGVASVPFRVFVGRLAWKPRAFGWPRRGSRDKLSVACYRAHPVMRERASRGRIMMARVIRAGGK